MWDCFKCWTVLPWIKSKKVFHFQVWISLQHDCAKDCHYQWFFLSTVPFAPWFLLLFGSVDLGQPQLRKPNAMCWLHRSTVPFAHGFSLFSRSVDFGEQISAQHNYTVFYWSMTPFYCSIWPWVVRGCVNMFFSKGSPAGYWLYCTDFDTHLFCN